MQKAQSRNRCQFGIFLYSLKRFTVKSQSRFYLEIFSFGRRHIHTTAMRHLCGHADAFTQRFVALRPTVCSTR
jgi:hypothetical protein